MGEAAQQHLPISEYREFAAPVALASYFVCLWTQSVDNGASSYRQRVLPDGCVDIVVMNEAAMVIGPSTRHFFAELAPGTMVVGARCLPGRAASLLGMPASKLVDQSVPLRDVLGNRVTSRFACVPHQTTHAARRSAMESALLDHLRNAKTASDEVVNAAVRWFARNPGGRMEELSRSMAISSRQLRRRFSAAVGYSPKMFQSIMRFQRLLYLAAQTGCSRPLAELAIETGYADQAHMSREVQRLSGNSPSVLLPSADSALQAADLFSAA
jgi:AraC-like DNA-binding protein